MKSYIGPKAILEKKVSWQKIESLGFSSKVKLGICIIQIDNLKLLG